MKRYFYSCGGTEFLVRHESSRQTTRDVLTDQRTGLHQLANDLPGLRR